MSSAKLQKSFTRSSAKTKTKKCLQITSITFIAIKCEGCELGLKKNSLGIIKMAECFDGNLLKPNRAKDKISINLKPGFMIKMPINENIIELMSAVFTDEHLSLITFDFIPNITSMIDAGIRINMKNIIDAKLTAYRYNRKKSLNNEKDISFQKAWMLAKNCVEYDAARSAFKKK